MTTKHSWKFFRAGGFDQVRLETGADLVNLDQLDKKLWVALACPTTGVEFDGKTLALIDTDKDGRIRPPELQDATRWAVNCLRNPDDLLKGSPTLPLAAINDSFPEGKALLASAKQILMNLGKKDAVALGLEDTSDTVKIFAQTQFNGDGIIPAEAAEDEPTRAVINEIITCLGAETDRSGRPGISQVKVDQFFADAQAFSDWWKKAEGDKNVRPLDGSTDAAVLTFRTVRNKIDDYFTRCRLAAFDARALSALNREEKEYLVFAAKDLTLSSAEIAGFPLARIGPAKSLSLENDLNPAWCEVMGRFSNEVVMALLPGKTSLSEMDWQIIQ
jgi:hypothetical protein